MRRWTIYDEKEGKEIRLTPRQIEIIKNIQNHRYAEPGYNDETEYIPYFSGEVSVLPWSDREPPKSHFTPSKGERRTINKILKGIREGRYKPRGRGWSSSCVGEKKERPMYDMWENEGEERKNAPPNLMAPKMPLPGNHVITTSPCRPQRNVQPARGVPPQRVREARLGAGSPGGPVLHLLPPHT